MVAELLSLLVAIAPPPEVASQPPRLPTPKWRAPVPAESKTTTGLQVAVLPRPELPLVDIVVMVRAGSELDPAEQPGLAAALALMLEEGGAGSRSATELIAAIDQLGGELEVHTDRTATTLHVSVLSRHLETALSLLADMVARPKLDEKAWAEAKQRRVAEIIALRDQPTAVAADAIWLALANGAPAGHSPLGTEKSVGSITVEQLRAFYAKTYGPKTVSVSVVGQTTAAAVTALAETAFKGFTGKATQPAAVAPTAGKPRWIFIDRPGAPQTSVRIGSLATGRKSPEYAANKVATTVLGGSFTSRLVQNIREKHGYSYGASSKVVLQRAFSPLLIGSEVRTDVTGLALTELLKELQGMTVKLSADELQKGKALVLSDLVDSYDTTESTVWSIDELLELDVPLDASSKLPEQLEALTVDSMLAAQQKLFRPGEVTVVMVGDRKLVEPQLKTVPGVQPLEFLDDTFAPAK